MSCKRLRELLSAGRTLVAPGATDALSAKLIEAAGFDCVYIGSYANALRVPVIAEAEGGFNDPANMWRTVQAFEQAGVAGIHIEDHSGSGKHTAQLAEIRRRTGKPAMVVDMPGRPLADHRDAAIVLYYGFSALARVEKLNAPVLVDEIADEQERHGQRSREEQAARGEGIGHRGAGIEHRRDQVAADHRAEAADDDGADHAALVETEVRIGEPSNRAADEDPKGDVHEQSLGLPPGRRLFGNAHTRSAAGLIMTGCTPSNVRNPRRYPP
jgi:hypothetical protein